MTYAATREHRPLVARLRREIPVLLGLLGLYELVRSFAGKNVGVAMRHAHDVVRVEEWMHLPSEASLQSPLLALPWLVRAMNLYYATVHLPLTALVMLWLLAHQPDRYRWMRRSLVAATATGLAVYVLLPVAPPRMLPGITDTGLRYGESIYGSAQAHTFADQYAAMPSLHVGWAVIVAVALVSSGRSRWRWAWLLHPLVTAFVVIGTGNHYWLDALAGAGLALTALTACREGTWPLSSRTRTRRTSAQPWLVRRAELVDVPACARLLAPTWIGRGTDADAGLPALRLFLTHVALDQAELWVHVDGGGTVRAATLELPPLDQLDTHGLELALALRAGGSTGHRDWATSRQ